MKKLLFLSFALAFIVFSVQAQFTYKITEATPTVKFVPTAADSLYASSVKTFTFTLPAEKLPYDYSIYYKTTQVRATAAYTAKLEESQDGVKFWPITNADNDVNSGGGNYEYIWRSIADTAVVSCRYVRVTITATSASQNSTIALNATFVPKKLR